MPAKSVRAMKSEAWVIDRLLSLLVEVRCLQYRSRLGLVYRLLWVLGLVMSLAWA